MSRPDRITKIDRDARGLSVRRQCTLLGLARSGVYRPPPRPTRATWLVLWTTARIS
jgi:putative transposase